VKIRIAILSLCLGIVCSGLAWLTLQPFLSAAVEALKSTPMGQKIGPQLTEGLGALAILNAVVISGLLFLALYYFFGAPVARAEETIDQIGTIDAFVAPQSGGPVLIRLQQSLKRLALALSEERQRSATQLAQLQANNDELLRLQSELVASDRLATVGKLAAGVAHEVGNPLAGILGYLSVIRSKTKTVEGLPDIVNSVESELQRIDDIVRALLDMGRPSRGKAEPVNVLSVVQSCVKLLKGTAGFEQVNVDIVIDDTLYLKAESGPLAQVLVNLLINAAQAMNGIGAIHISANSAGEIHVADEGPGIPKDVMPRLFEPFFTTKAAGKGSGLGLSVSKHLLEQFGGDLTASNRSDGKTGAIFTVTLPTV
jgi:two-component system, NtrC family, sensor kinase